MAQILIEPLPRKPLALAPLLRRQSVVEIADETRGVLHPAHRHPHDDFCIVYFIFKRQYDIRIHQDRYASEGERLKKAVRVIAVAFWSEHKIRVGAGFQILAPRHLWVKFDGLGVPGKRAAHDKVGFDE